MKNITSITKLVSTLTHHELEQCYALLLVDFHGITWEIFMKDMKEKKDVMLLINKHDAIVGFSTLMICDLIVDARVAKVIFSGDTAVAHDYRSSFGFANQLAKYFAHTLEEFPNNKVYYILTSKGWRTYRILPFYFNTFAPGPNNPLLHKERAIVTAFCDWKYKGQYDRATGLLRGYQGSQRLKEESDDSVPPKKNDAYVQFFFEKNPGFLNGDEIVCIAQVSENNFTNVTKRLIRFVNTEEMEEECKD